MSGYLKTNTATWICVGPFFDKTDGVTPETALTVANSKITLIAETDDNSAPTIILDNVAGSDATNTLAHITNDDAGYYNLKLTAANLNRLGRVKLAIVDAANHCPVFHEYVILPANVYDSIVAGTDALQVDAIQVSGTVQTARDIGASVLLSSGTGTGQISLSSGAVTAGTVSDKTGYSLSTTPPTAADIWSYVTRTLTSGGGASAADVWNYLLTAMTTAGSVGKKFADLLAVFNDTTRTLTSSASATAAALVGSNMVVTNGVTYSQTITGLTIPADWTAIYLTMKVNKDAQADTRSDMQFKVSNPAVAGTDGITYINRAAAGTDRTKGSLTVSQANGTITIAILPTLDVSGLVKHGAISYDLKCVSTAAGDTLLQGAATATFQMTETRATA